MTACTAAAVSVGAVDVSGSAHRVAAATEEFHATKAPCLGGPELGDVSQRVDYMAAILQRARVARPGSKAMTPSPVRNASGGQVIGSITTPTRS